MSAMGNTFIPFGSSTTWFPRETQTERRTVRRVFTKSTSDRFRPITSPRRSPASPASRTRTRNPGSSAAAAVTNLS